MTDQELSDKFNNEFGLHQWPKTYPVDATTYSNICNYVFSKRIEMDFIVKLGFNYKISVIVGPSGGIMFKNIELILVQ